MIVEDYDSNQPNESEGERIHVSFSAKAGHNARLFCLTS